MENALCKELLKNVKKSVLVKSMKKDEWQNLRRGSIGGSDSGAIMGLNKWSSPLTVYLDKKGFNPFKGNEATRRGTWLEAPIRERCKEELRVMIEKVPFMFYSNEYPFMSANIDGLIYTSEEKTINQDVIQGLGGLEIKVSERGEGFDDEEIPDSYFAQVQHYMAVLNLPYFILSLYIINKDEIKHYIVKRKDDFIESLIEKEKDFWENYIEKEVMPSPTGCDAENKAIEMVFEGSNEIITLDGEAESLCAEYLLINKEIKAKEERKASISNKIKLKIIDKQNGSEDGKSEAHAGSYKILYSKNVRKSLDAEALKKAGLYEQYSKETQFTTLRITEPKN